MCFHGSWEPEYKAGHLRLKLWPAKPVRDVLGAPQGEPLPISTRTMSHSTVHILSGSRHKDVFPQVRDNPKVPATGSSGLVYSTSLALPCLLPKLEILWKNAVRVQRPAHLGQRLPNLETPSQPVLTVEKTSTRARPRPHYLL